MSTTTFPEHARQVADLLNEQLKAGHISAFDLKIDQRSTLRGFVKGQVNFSNGSELHFREFVDTTLAESKIMYVYHYQASDGTLVFRYDNAMHRPPLSHPEHKHTSDKVAISGIPTLQQVLDEILR